VSWLPVMREMKGGRQVSMLLFMPWCPIDSRYETDEISILPYDRDAPIECVDDLSRSRINKIMRVWRDIEGNPMQRAAVVRYGDKSLIEDLDEEEIETVYELVSLACFSGLANRDYCQSLGAYCNTDCFALHVQKFDEADSIALVLRRREGRTLSLWSFDDISVTIPVHCHTIRLVSLDKPLLDALISHRTELGGGQWGRWQNAIGCFNQANRDSDSIPYQVEWVLLCSALEHLLEAKANAKDIARRFSENITPRRDVLASAANRRSETWPADRKTLRYEWMREFYRIRGDFAHGRLNSRQSVVWNPLEHLVLATIAFPLVAKSLLNKVGKYTMTDNDGAQIDCFERFADTKDFLRPPPDPTGSTDSHWSRLVRECAWDRAFDDAIGKIPGAGESPGE